MREIYWESIDESLYEEAGEKGIVQVFKDKEYLTEMYLQNKRVIAYLAEKYPERRFRLKSYPHDFGTYQEIEEGVEWEEEDNEELEIN